MYGLFMYNYVKWLIVLVRFTSKTYFAMESMRYVEIGVMLSGGTIGTTLTVTVLPSEQSPISAMGMSVICRIVPLLL